MTVEGFLSRLEGVRRSGDGWTARCRGHDDHRASLSVMEGDGGKVIIKCHAGCQPEAVVGAMGLEMTDLFPETGRLEVRPSHARTAPAAKPPPPPPLGADQVAAMAMALRQDEAAMRHITDALRFDLDAVEEAQLGLYVVGGRRFLAYPYRRDGVWTFANCRSLDGPKGFVRVPRGQATHVYNIDQIEEGGTAIVVEGERDTLAALSMSLGAEVGGASGAAVVGMPGAAQVNVVAEALRRQRLVYLLTDSDEAGDEAAAKLADRLGADKCRRARLDGFKDLGDLLTAKGKDEALTVALAAIEAAKPMTAGDSLQVAQTATGIEVGGFSFVRASDVAEEPTEWLIENFVARRELTDLSGDPGVGKGAVTVSWAAQVTRGIDRGPENVIMCVTEDRLGHVKARLRAQGADLSRVIFLDIGSNQRTPALPHDIEAIEALVRETRAGLVVLDPALEFMDGGLDSHKQQDVQQFTAALAGLAHRTGAAVVVVRHLNKANGVAAIYKGAGSIAFVARARMALLIAKDKASGGRVLSVVKGNISKDTHSVTFEILEKDDSTVVAWGEPTVVTADELVNQDPRKPARGPKPEKAEACEEFLRELLATTAMVKGDVRAAAKRKGFGRTLVYEVAKKMKLKDCPVNLMAGWSLP